MNIDQHNRIIRGKDEVFWVNELAHITLTSLPFFFARSSELGTTSTENFAYSDTLEFSTEIADTLQKIFPGKKLADIWLAIWLVYLYRLNQEENLGISITDQTLMQRQLEDNFLVNQLPFSINFQHQFNFIQALECVVNKLNILKHYKPYSKDIHLRYPTQIKQEFSPTITVIMDQLEVDTYPLNSSIILAISHDALSAKLWIRADVFTNLCKNGFPPIHQHVMHLINSIIANAQQPISLLSYLTSVETNYLLVVCNQTTSNYPSNETIHTLFEQQVQRMPKQVAVIFQGKKVTYSELNEKANQLARYLQNAYHISHDKPLRNIVIGVVCERSLEMIVCMLAILKIGAAYLPIDPNYPKKRIEEILLSSKITVMLLKNEYYKNLKHIISTEISKFILEDLLLISKNQFSDNLPSSSLSNSLVYVMYTSGSTGIPKGVKISHRGVIRLVKNTNYIKINQNDFIAHAANVSFDAATFEIWGALLNGATIVVFSHEQVLDSFLFLSLIKNEKISILWLTSSLFNHFTDMQPEAFSQLNYLLVGGEALSVKHMTKLMEAPTRPKYIINGYGPTENTTFTTYYLIKSLSAETTAIPIGKPIANTQVYVLDQYLQPVPIGVKGELYIGGDGLALGYLNNIALTEERFICNPFNSNANAYLYKTGDLVYWSADGNLSYIGRIDNQIKLRGFRIELEEINIVLAKHPAIDQALVTAEKKSNTQEIDRLVAYVVLNNKIKNLTGKDFQQFLKESLPEYMIPSLYIPLDQLPVTSNGKIDLGKLPKTNISNFLATIDKFELPKTPTEIILSEIWKETLFVEKIDVNDDFMMMGGTSLKAFHMILSINKKFSVNFSIVEFLCAKNISHQAKLIDKNKKNTTNELNWQVRTDKIPLSYPQESIWFLQNKSSDDTSYNAQCIISILGNIDKKILEKTLKTIIQRHEIFRTTFPVLEGKPIQKIHQNCPLHIKYSDLTTIELLERDVQLQQQLVAHSKISFDLEKLPLIQWCFFQLTADRYVLSHVEHHLLHDGWSLRVFLTEFIKIYTDYYHQTPVSLPPLKVQFADYVVWQKNKFKDIKHDKLAFWVEKLSGDLPKINLGNTTFERHTNKRTGSVVRLEIPLILCNDIVLFAKQNGYSLFTVLFSVFNILLYCYTQETDICVGSGVANREIAESETLIGMIVNTIALRSDLSGNPDFYTVLSRIHQTNLMAYQHQEVPFYEVVKAVNPQRKFDKNPFFQIVFSCHDALMPKLYLPEAKLFVQEGLIGGSAKFDLNVIAIPRMDQPFKPSPEAEEQGITIIWEYDNSVLTESKVQKIADHYLSLLQSAITIPDQSINYLSFLPPDQLKKILIDKKMLLKNTKNPLTITTDFTEPRNEFEAQLLMIWQEILSVKKIGVKDNFFALGGHSLLLISLVTQIEKFFNKKLPISLIFENPTIEKLAGILSSSTSCSLVSPLIVIKTKTQEILAPLVCIHPSSGLPFRYMLLSPYLHADRPIYGMQDPSIGQKTRFSSLEEMSHCYIKALKKQQPTGPYVLSGYSLGGVVAYEMAQQLTLQGNIVQYVILLDSVAGYLPNIGNYKKPIIRLRRLARKIKYPLSQLKIDVSYYFLRAMEYLTGQPMSKLTRDLLHEREIRHRTYLLRRYTFKPYHGRVALIKASEKLHKYDIITPTKDNGWHQYAPNLETSYCSGHHTNMTKEPHIQSVAARINEILAAI